MNTHTVLRTVRRSSGSGPSPGGTITDWRTVVKKGEKCRITQDNSPGSMYVGVTMEDGRFEMVRRTTLKIE